MVALGENASRRGAGTLFGRAVPLEVEVTLEKLADPRCAAKQIQFCSLIANRVIAEAATEHKTKCEVLQTVVFEIAKDVAE